MFDFAAEYLDYGLYATFEDNDMVFFDREIPLWQMVYNGIIMHNPSTTTVNHRETAPGVYEVTYSDGTVIRVDHNKKY